MRKRNVESEKQTILREPESSYEKALKQKYRGRIYKRDHMCRDPVLQRLWY